MMDRDDIARLLPHAGDMVLLDSLIETDARMIRCTTGTHRSGTHPLLSDGYLSALAGIEIGAQAMALHAAMQDPRPHAVEGRLAQVRDVVLHHDRLDDQLPTLSVEATLDGSSGNLRAYRFSISAGPRVLVQGRATVIRLEGEAA